MIDITVNGKIVSCNEGSTLLDCLGSQISSPCGGKGTCGKCRVMVNGRSVLACQTQAVSGMEVTTEDQSQLLVELGGSSAQVECDWVGDVADLALAVDIGTTTVAVRLMRLKTGEALGELGMANSQSAYGADVISRISACQEGKLPELTGTIVGQINSMAAQLCRDCRQDISQVKYMAVAANTVMCHIFAGLSPESIGVAPFTPLSLFGQELDAEALGLNFRGKVYILPAVAGYVGGDITADLLACGLSDSHKPILMIDVGTNGEMALWKDGKFYCCATAAGPAFEGAQIEYGMMASEGAISRVKVKDGSLDVAVIGGGSARGLCGSGLLDAVAAMLELGAMEDTGRIMDDDEAEEAALKYLEDRENGTVLLLKDGVAVTQRDIRNIQLAKAAIRAGAQVLLAESGTQETRVDSLLLAGGFGSHLDPASAAAIGMIPPSLLPVTRAVGNAALEGAAMAALSSRCRAQLDSIRSQCQYIELSGLKAFTDEYVDQMMFPEDE